MRQPLDDSERAELEALRREDAACQAANHAPAAAKLRRMMELEARERFQCRFCDGKTKHELACKYWPGGEVTLEDLVSFLFSAASPSSDGPRTMDMLERQAAALLQRFELKKREEK